MIQLMTHWGFNSHYHNSSMRTFYRFTNELNNNANMRIILIRIPKYNSQRYYYDMAIREEEGQI